MIRATTRYATVRIARRALLMASLIAVGAVDGALAQSPPGSSSGASVGGGAYPPAGAGKGTGTAGALTQRAGVGAGSDPNSTVGARPTGLTSSGVAGGTTAAPKTIGLGPEHNAASTGAPKR